VENVVLILDEWEARRRGEEREEMNQEGIGVG